MKYSLILAVFLTGCSTFLPVSQPWPKAPDELFETCPMLKTVPEDTSKLSVIIDSVTENYSTYYACQAKHEEWVNWYKKQKEIYESNR